MTSPLVQETSGSTTGTSLTLTLGSAATLGNGIIIAVSGFNGGTISGITLGRHRRPVHRGIRRRQHQLTTRRSGTAPR